MKRYFAILIMIVILISLSACKRRPENPDQAGGSLAFPDVSDENQKPDTEQQSADATAEKTDEKVIKAQKPDNFDSDKSSEAEKPVKTEEATNVPSNDVSAKDASDSKNSSEKTENEVSESEPFLPLSLGYVEEVEVNGRKKYIAKTDDFRIEFPITDEIRTKAWRDTNMDAVVAPFIYKSPTHFGVWNSCLEDIEAIYPQDRYVVIRGSFLAEHGTSITDYKKIDNIPEDSCKGYYADKAFTRYNFKVDKVYTSCDKFDVGDTISIVKYGTIRQEPDGKYLASPEYTDFGNKSLEERTFVMILRYDNYEDYGGYQIGSMLINAYTPTENNTGDKDKQILYDYLHKYN